MKGCFLTYLRGTKLQSFWTLLILDQLLAVCIVWESPDLGEVKWLKVKGKMMGKRYWAGCNRCISQENIVPFAFSEAVKHSLVWDHGWSRVISCCLPA